MASTLHYHQISEDWLVAEKPAPLLIHPTRPDGEPTLWQALSEDFPEENLCLINRLDRETSGLVLAGRHTEASSTLGKMAQARTIHKTYLALVRGRPEVEGEIDAPILRRSDVEESPTYVEQIIHPEGKPCQTRYRCLEIRYRDQDPVALLELRLLTGRMHQIRVHLKHIGLPVVGDKLYGPDISYYIEVARTGWNDSMFDGLWLRRQALHAGGLEFEWKGSPIRIESPLPPDLNRFWNSLSAHPPAEPNGGLK